MITHCLSTTKIIRLVYDTKWKGGMQRIRRKWQKSEKSNASPWLKIHLRLIFLICVQTQILCNRANDAHNVDSFFYYQALYSFHYIIMMILCVYSDMVVISIQQH